jgi:hypothetical protein
LPERERKHDPTLKQCIQSRQVDYNLPVTEIAVDRNNPEVRLDQVEQSNANRRISLDAIDANSMQWGGALCSHVLA